jgi:hypothetical protein
MITVRAILCHFNFPIRQSLLPVEKIYESLNFQFVHLTWKEKIKELIFIFEGKQIGASLVWMSRLLI